MEKIYNCVFMSGAQNERVLTLTVWWRHRIAIENNLSHLGFGLIAADVKFSRVEVSVCIVSQSDDVMKALLLRIGA